MSNKTYNAMDIWKLVFAGFNYEKAVEYLETKDYYCNREPFTKNLYSCFPLNESAEKMFEDRLSSRTILIDFAENFAEYYSIAVGNDNGKRLKPLMDYPYDEISSLALVNLLKEKKAFSVKAAKNNYFEKGDVVCFDGEKFSINSKAVTEDELAKYFDELTDDTIVTRYVLADSKYVEEVGLKDPAFHVVVLNSGESAAKVVDSFFTEYCVASKDELVDGCKKIVREFNSDDALVKKATELAQKISTKYQEMKYFDFSFRFAEDKVYILDIDTGKDLLLYDFKSEEVSKYIDTVQKQAKAHKLSLFKIIKRNGFIMFSKRKGFENFMYSNWVRGLIDDAKYKGTSLSQKLWCWKKGFYSYRIKQYGLDKDNYSEILSDYDYKRIRPLNSSFRKWFWDKELSYYILRQFGDIVPRYYYRIKEVDKVVKILSYDDVDGRTLCTPSDVVDTLVEKGKLVIKPSIGSHGKGFYKLTFDSGNNIFTVNDKECSRKDVEELIGSIKKNYLVSEYIEMHDELKKIYDKVACTIRVMTINDGSSDSYIKDAYFRIGTSRTGNTDNLSSGGATAKVDVVTGKLYNPETLKNHEFVPCQFHPDTGTPIDGVIPNWEEVKAGVTHICETLSTLEYLGFDIVVTNDGFKVLELNTHQDLHKYVEYCDDIKNYFRKKLKK